MNDFALTDSNKLMPVRLIFLLSLKPFDSYFLGMMYVEFVKNFLLAYSSELMVVRLILAS